MDVRLVSATPDPLMAVGSAGAITRGITHAEFALKVERHGREWLEAYVRTLYELGHWSVFEFAAFDFEVTSASRVFETQAVRSRIGSYEWESGRHNQTYEVACWEPGDELWEPVRAGIDEYQALAYRGIPAEDARYALPMGVARKGRLCKNFRALMETAHQRLCSKAQQEYRDFMMQCKSLVCEAEPVLGELMMPKCKWLGYCTELNGCGLMRPKREVLCDGGNMREMQC